MLSPSSLCCTIKKKYFDMYSKDLGQVAASELSGNLENLMLNVMQANEEKYDPDYHTQAKLEEDAAMLYKKGQGKWGTDEVGLFKFLVKAPPVYLQKLNLVYADKYGYTLPKVMEKEFGGQLRDAACFMMGMKLHPDQTVAELVDKACRGWGTNELLLTTVLIRYQPILKQVDAAHKRLYDQSIEDRVISETGGDYRKVLKEIIHTGMNL